MVLLWRLEVGRLSGSPCSTQAENAFDGVKANCFDKLLMRVL